MNAIKVYLHSIAGVDKINFENKVVPKVEDREDVGCIAIQHRITTKINEESGSLGVNFRGHIQIA